MVVGLLSTQAIYAQYSQDAFRFSTTDRGGSARIRALGGTSTALGGDVSSISINPAGLGFFNSSEFSITPEFNATKTNGTYFGQTNTADRNRGNLGNVSIVFNTPQRVFQGTDPTKGLLAVNYGISWNRSANYNQKIWYGGFNPNNSVADMLAERAYQDGRTLDELNKASNPLGWWGYEHYLVDTTGSNSSGLLYAPNTKLNAGQNIDRLLEGGQNELNFAIGANYGNKFYIGGSIGFANINFNSTRTLSEEGELAKTSEQYQTYLDEYQETRASGFNFKLGMIYRPVKALQLGASFTSPTWYSVDDNYSVSMETRYAQGDYFPPKAENFPSQYNLRTPLKVSGGATVFFQQRGFISADVEYVGYSGMKLDGYDGSTSDNNALKSLYKSTVNVRVGAEGRLTDNFYLRGGYAFMDNPQKEIGGATNMVSGGLGYRINKFSIDATFVNTTRKSTVYAYELYAQDAISPAANLKTTQNSGYLTFAYRF